MVRSIPKAPFHSKLLEQCVLARMRTHRLGGPEWKAGVRGEIAAGSEGHSQEPVHSYDQRDVFSGQAD